MLFDVHMTNKERKWNETTTQDASFLCNHTFVSLSHVNRQNRKTETATQKEEVQQRKPNKEAKKSRKEESHKNI